MLEKPEVCQLCVGWAWGQKGFMPHPTGTMANGVVLVGEALGEEEAKTGQPFVGRAGLALTRMLERVELKREDFLIDNVLRCQPKSGGVKNALGLEEGLATAYCPFLGETLRVRKPRVIVPMGAVALRRILGWDEAKGGISAHRGYVSWSERHNCYVLPTFHPAYIMRGQQRLTPVFNQDIVRATEIARMGFKPHQAVLRLDPTPEEFNLWVADFESAVSANRDTFPLAYDIETAGKAGKDESALDIGDESAQILRISFAWRMGEGLSIPWDAAYFSGIRRLLCEGRHYRYVWNESFDNPRLALNGFPVAQPRRDAMLAWHVLNSDLERGLAFVATFACPDQARWKHLAETEPARYSAIDAEVLLRIVHWVMPQLRKHGLLPVFERHICHYDECLGVMSAAGLKVDQQARSVLHDEVVGELSVLQRQLDAAASLGGRKKKIYLRTGADETEGEWVDVPVEVEEKTCSRCGVHPVLKAHVTRKRDNPCHGAPIEKRMYTVTRRARVHPFTPSNKQLRDYSVAHGYRMVHARDGVITFNDEALKVMIGRYPKDELFPLVSQYRDRETLLTRYIGHSLGGGEFMGGLSVAHDGRVHTTYGHTPSTLRLSSSNPNMQNNDPRIKALFVAEQGFKLLELDFSAIEAVLVGYFAGDRDYIRLAKLGVHDYLASHMVGHPATMGRDDGELHEYLQWVKKHFRPQREAAKRVVHGSNYGMTPRRMFELYPEHFPTLAHAQKLQAMYFEVCGSVKRWQERTVRQADKQGYLKNPFGYLHRFWQVLDWKHTPDGWVASWGEPAKQALAFLPQSTASAILAEVIIRLFDRGLGLTLRLQNHDALLAEIHEANFDNVAEAIDEEMRRPITQLPLDPVLGLGTHLSIGTEGKVGERWIQGMSEWRASVPHSA